MMLAKTDFDFQTTAGFHDSHNFFPSCWLKEKKMCHMKMFLSLLCSTMQLFPIYAMEFCFPYSPERVIQSMNVVLKVTKSKQCKCSIIMIAYVI